MNNTTFVPPLFPAIEGEWTGCLNLIPRQVYTMWLQVELPMAILTYIFFMRLGSYVGIYPKSMYVFLGGANKDANCIV